MMKYAYKIVGHGRQPIKRVEVVSETACFMTFIEMDWGERVERKEKKAGNIYPTFEEARAEWQAQNQRKADALRQRVARLMDIVGNAKGLKNPYEVDS
jgi:hypothetical protein